MTRHPDDQFFIGPWIENSLVPARQLPEQYGPDRMAVEIATAHGHTVGYYLPAEWDGSCPNSDLMIAAPQLLAALRGWLAIFEKPGAYVSPLVAAALRDTNAAISKACPK